MAITAVEILTQPEHGHVSVNPDNTLAFVASRTDFTGAVTFTYEVTHDNATTEQKTKTVLIEPSPQQDGWGTGENLYMLPVDASGRVIVEHDDDHRKVYVSGDGLTAADIAALEGITEGDVTPAWLENNPEYGGSEDKALDSTLGIDLWYELQLFNFSSNWLLLERGYDYPFEDLFVPKMNGSSPLHPTLIGAWGAGAAPKITGPKPTFNGNYTHRNLVVRDIDFSTGFKTSGVNKNLLFENLMVGGQSGIRAELENPIIGATLRNSIVKDIWRSSPTVINAEGEWDPFPNRATGIFITGTVGLLFDGVIFDHIGWAPDFAPDGSSEGGNPPSQYSHNLYVQSNTRDVTMRNFINMRGASYGAHFMGGAYVQDSLFLANNIPLDVTGGDYEGDGPVGNYSLLDGNVVTVGGWKGGAGFSLPLGGAFEWGISNKARLTSFTNNIIAHGHNNDELAPADDFMSEYALDHVNGVEVGVFSDDTIIWRWGIGNKGEDGVSANTDGLDPAVMNATTIQGYAASLSLPTATDPVFTGYTPQGVADFAQYLRTLDGSEYAAATQDVLSYFRTGFGIAETARATATTLRFIPDPRGDGVRWDNRLNWDSGDLPGTVAGDSVDLGGNEVIFAALTVTIPNLTFGRFGGLTVNSGRLTVTGALSVSEGGALNIGNSGQVWLSGTVTGTNDFAVTVTSGRFANTSTYDLPGAVTVTGNRTQAVLATAGGSFTVDDLIVDALSLVGFDDSATGTATLTCTATSTLTCLVDNANIFRPIGKFRSGAYGDDNSGLTTAAALDGSLIVDLENYTGGAQTLTLIDVDTLTGSFASTQVINVPDGLTASVTQNATTITLTIS